MKHLSTLGLIAALSIAAGCTADDYGPRETVGGLTGAVVGGLVGDQFGSGSGNDVATGAGVLIGALIGSEIGRSMDDVDRLRANDAVRRSYTAPLGTPITWNNPATGNSGTVIALRDGTSTAGNYCREYQQTIIIGGRREQGVGVACQQADGTWRIVS